MCLPKTGTTAVQNTVFRNRNLLLEKYRILYPSIDANHTNGLCIMFLPDPRTHVTVKMAGITTEREAEILRTDHFKRMERELDSAGWDTLVLNAEGLANLSMPSLVELKNWTSKYVDSWQVVYWVRHPLDFTKSLMQQMIKGGYTIDEMMELLPLTNFEGRISNGFRSFGKENVQLYRYEDARSSNGGVVAEYCRQIGLDKETALGISEGAVFENESMSMLATHVLDRLNKRRPLFVDGQLNPLRGGTEITWVSRLKGSKFDLFASQKRKICTASRSDVLWLNEQFGVNYYLDVLGGDDEYADPLEIYSNEVLDSIAITFSDMINA